MVLGLDHVQKNGYPEGGDDGYGNKIGKDLQEIQVRVAHVNRIEYVRGIVENSNRGDDYKEQRRVVYFLCLDVHNYSNVIPSTHLSSRTPPAGGFRMTAKEFPSGVRGGFSSLFDTSI